MKTKHTPGPRIVHSSIVDGCEKLTPFAVRFGKSRELIGVASIGEASRLWERVRDDRNLGSSNSPLVSVIDTTTGARVATISYNGRAWDLDGMEIA